MAIGQHNIRFHYLFIIDFVYVWQFIAETSNNFEQTNKIIKLADHSMLTKRTESLLN